MIGKIITVIIGLVFTVIGLFLFYSDKPLFGSILCGVGLPIVLVYPALVFGKDPIMWDGDGL